MDDAIRGPLISALGSFLGVLVATALVPWIRSRFSRRRTARHLAIRVVCTLDRFIEDCAAVACDWGSENQEGVSKVRVSAPPPPSYPSDLDWHSVHYSLMYELLALPAAADRAARMVDAASDNADPPDYSEYFEARSFEYATLGLMAYELTVKLRKEYGIRDLDRTAWNPIDQLKQELKGIREREEKRKAHWENTVLPNLPSPPIVTP